MGKLFKILLGGGVIMLVGVALLIWFVFSNLDEIVRRAVEQVGAETTGTRVTLDGVLISVKSTEGALAGLTIANPPGYESPNAFELEQVLLGIDLSTVRSEEIVVREVTVEGAHLTFEQRGDSNNLQTLLDHVESVSDEESNSADGEQEEIRFVIETFTFSGGEVTVIHERLEEELSFPIPDVVVHDIGRVGAGETVDSVARQLLEPVLKRTLDSAEEQARAMLEQRLEQEVEDRKQEAVDSLRNRLLGDD